MNEFDKELSLTNTPLENLRTILSEADASVEAVPTDPLKPVGSTVSKGHLALLVERLTNEPQQFMSSSAIDKMLNALIAPPTDYTGARSAVFENKAVADLERLLRNYSSS